MCDIERETYYPVVGVFQSLPSCDRSRSLSPGGQSSSHFSTMSEASSETECEAKSAEGGDGLSHKVKLEFRALGLPETKRSDRFSRAVERVQNIGSPNRFLLKKLPPGGLNDFGFFDYNHYGLLCTPITPAHQEFTMDTGIIGMDCEMVGVGPMRESALGRVSIVNEYGFCLYDKFVKPKWEVTDYRTSFSGIRETDLRNATPFPIVAKEVSDILRSHVLVGHSLKSDLSVLYLSHPKARTRDTAVYFKKILQSKTPKLKMLVKKLLGVDIQQGEHSSIIDAQAAIALYRVYQKEWEMSVRQSNRGFNVLKHTLDEFKELRFRSSATSFQSTVVPTPPLIRNCYETIDGYEPLVYNHADLHPSPSSIVQNNYLYPEEFPPAYSLPTYHAMNMPLPPPPPPQPMFPCSFYGGLPPASFPPPCCAQSQPMCYPPPPYPHQFFEPPPPPPGVLIPVFQIPSWNPTYYPNF